MQRDAVHRHVRSSRPDNGPRADTLILDRKDLRARGFQRVYGLFYVAVVD